jgi:hypothetical protein
MRATLLAALLALTVLLGPRDSNAAATVTITGCQTVTLNGNAYVQYSFQIYNDPANHLGACDVVFSHPVSGGAPDDTCSFVASEGPPGWLASGTSWFTDCFVESNYVMPGQSLSGVTLVLTRPCCFDAYLSNAVMDQFGQERVCLNCPTPTRDRTWGALKATYR